MHARIVSCGAPSRITRTAQTGGPEGSGFDGTEEHPVTPMPTTHDRGADTMTYCYDHVKDRTLTLAKEKGREVTLGVLASFGVERAYNLAPEYWADYIDAVNEILGNRITFPSGASVITAGDKIVARVEPEPMRPALTWATKTLFDAFGPDFKVYSDPASSGFAPSAAPEQNHPLQRVSDTSKPAHASAYLLG